MKNYAKLLVTTALITGLILSFPLSATQVKAETVGIGSAGAFVDNELTLEDMLVYAIQDEYMAQAEYTALMEAFSALRPYSNIVKAEAIHIQELLPLFEAYGYSVPVDDAASSVVLPETLEDSYSLEVIAELNNIAMYEKFLAQDLPEDVRLVFEALKAASEMHLVAFERAVDRVESGVTYGYGRGAGGNGGRRGDSPMNGDGTMGGALGGNMGRGMGNRGNGNYDNNMTPGICTELGITN